MKGVRQWGIVLAVMMMLTGCGGEKELGKPKPPAPVAAAKLPGDLTYQDVLQKGEVVHNLAMTSDSQSIWVGTHAGLYSSVGNGLWALLSPALEQEDVSGWYVDPEKQDHIYVGGIYGVKRTTDGGKTWKEANAGLPDTPNIHSFTGIREGDHVRLFAFVTGEGIYQSTNGGDQWKLWLPLDQEVYAMDYNAAENRLYVATQYGLLYNQNETWETENLPDVEQIYSLAVDRRDGTVAVATEQGIVQKTAGEWRLLSAKAPEKLIVIAPGMGDYKWVGIGESAFVYALSQDNWMKWE
ncbi:WD40/YVTN/BNR-like repeat-containing protein [Brevibacillus sp. H7]|jgi:ligand-binding sensor domain-containing protein|uniref:WD40/YVTN/BNR-like repeat-containing protein n=1 Tax=Brevibacillus sp. H7 TaxID=3349138 RepID=UPI00380B2EDF